MKRAVDGDNITLGQHFLKAFNTSAADLLLLFRAQGLVVKVQQLLAVERLQAAKNTLTNTANGNGTDDLALKVVLVLGHSGDIPVSLFNLFVGRNEVADEGKDGHDDVFGNRDDVAAGDLSNGDTTVGLVGGVQVNVVRTDTSSDGNLKLLGFGKTLGSQVAGVEAGGASVNTSG